jgi:hypothetical protein
MSGEQVPNCAKLEPKWIRITCTHPLYTNVWKNTYTYNLNKFQNRVKAMCMYSMIPYRMNATCRVPTLLDAEPTALDLVPILLELAPMQRCIISHIPEEEEEEDEEGEGEEEDDNEGEEEAGT